MRYLCLWMCGVALWAFGGCSDDEPNPGSRGGACRVGLSPCDDGLVCRDGACRIDDGESAVALDVVFSFLQNNEVRDALALYANGTDTAGVQVEVFRRDTGAPYEGAVRLWLEPQAAGTLSEVQVPLEDGVARVVFRACSNTDPNCPDRALLKVADVLRPLEVVAVAPALVLFGGNPPSMGAGGEGGGGGGGGAGGGGGLVDPANPPGSAVEGTPYTWEEACNRTNTFNLGPGAVDFEIVSWQAAFQNDGFVVSLDVREPSSGLNSAGMAFTLRPVASPGTYRLSEELIMDISAPEFGGECTTGSIRWNGLTTVGEPPRVTSFKWAYDIDCAVGGVVTNYKHCLNLGDP